MRKQHDNAGAVCGAIIGALIALNIACAYYVQVERREHVYLDNSPPAMVAKRPAMSSWHIHGLTNVVDLGCLSPAQAAQFKTNTAWFLAAHGVMLTREAAIDVHTPGGSR